MSKYFEYKSTHDAIMSLPFIRDLIENNKKLKKENSALKYIMFSTNAFSNNKCNCHCNCKGKNIKKCKNNFMDEIVIIKEEKNTEDVVEVKNVVEVEDIMEEEEEEEEQEEEQEDINNLTNLLKNMKIDDKKNISENVRIEIEIIENQKEEVEMEVEEEVEMKVEEAVEMEVEEEVEMEVEEAVEEEVEMEVEETVEMEVEETVEMEVEEAVEMELEEEEEEESEVFEITISGKKYYTNNEVNGKIYSIEKDEEVGDEIGVFVNSVAKFIPFKGIKI